MIRKAASSKGWNIGVDLGGHNIRGSAARGLRYSKRQPISRPTDFKADARGIADQILSVVQDVAKSNRVDRSKVTGIGIAVPGPNDGKIIAKLPNFPNSGRNIRMASLVEQRLRRAGFTRAKVSMGNDATVATAAEWMFGVGKGGKVKEMEWFTISSGIGGGNVFNGRIHFGATGASGEPGHVSVVNPHSKEAKICGCGGRGHAEAHASATAIEKMALEARSKGDWIKVLERGIRQGQFKKRDEMQKELEELRKSGTVSAKAVFKAANRLKDPTSLGIVNDAAEHLTTLLDNVHHLNNPKVIVLGGGAGKAILPYAKKALRQRSGATPQGHLSIIAGKLGGDAGVIGASLWPELIRKGMVG